jgi:7-carboxy-7-deazaguanine synthase
MPDTLHGVVQSVWMDKTIVRRPLVVLTGGEPFRQFVSPFVRELTMRDYPVQVETNGTLCPPIIEDSFPWYYEKLMIVCSPKAPKIHPGLHSRIHCLKYVLDYRAVDPADGLPTSVLESGVAPARPWKGFAGPVYVNPADTGDPVHNKANLDACVQSCMKFGHRLGIQLHKLIGVD